MEGQREQTGCRPLVGIVLGPPALMSVYLGLSRWPARWFTEISDLAALVLSVGAGVIWIGRLPVPDAVRGVLALLYVPVVGFVLVMYSLAFVGYMFGDWL